MELNDYLVAWLTGKQKSYVTLRTIRDSLPAPWLKSMGLVRGKSALTVVRKRISPHLGKRLKLYEGPRTWYLGFAFTINELILQKLKQKPNLSCRQLRNQLPVKNDELMVGINDLLASSQITCQLHPQTHRPKSFTIFEQRKPSAVGPSVRADEALFEEAFRTVGNGRQFVRIHEIRGYLNWPDKRFDNVLETLKSAKTIQLQGGDPSLLSKEELKKSYTDQKGRIRITINWVT